MAATSVLGQKDIRAPLRRQSLGTEMRAGGEGSCYILVPRLIRLNSIPCVGSVPTCADCPHPGGASRICQVTDKHANRQHSAQSTESLLKCNATHFLLRGRTSMDLRLPPSLEGRYPFGLSRCRNPRSGGYLTLPHNAPLSGAALRVFYRQTWNCDLGC